MKKFLVSAIFVMAIVACQNKQQGNTESATEDAYVPERGDYTFKTEVTVLEDVDEVIVGVAPEDSARKTLMSKCFLAGGGWQDRAFLLVTRRVKAQAATLAAVQHIGGSEQLDGLLLEEGDAVVSAAIHQHLEENGQVADVGE